VFPLNDFSVEDRTTVWLALLHLFRVGATGSYLGRRILNWWIGLTIFMIAVDEKLFGLLARGDWESQFVSIHSDNMLFIQPFFFNLFSPGNFTVDLTIHIAVIPVIMFGLILAHIVLILWYWRWHLSAPFDTSSSQPWYR
jgi:quinol-cytochrome oxidoreductase complex cytochrome b subunit